MPRQAPPPPPVAAPQPPPERETLYVKVGRLNLRAGPGMDFPKLGLLERNEEVEKIGEAENWYQVRVKRDGTLGWVSSEYLSKTPVTVPIVTPVPETPAAPPPAETKPPKPARETNVPRAPQPEEIEEPPPPPKAKPAAETVPPPPPKAVQEKPAPKQQEPPPPPPPPTTPQPTPEEKPGGIRIM